MNFSPSLHAASLPSQFKKTPSVLNVPVSDERENLLPLSSSCLSPPSLCCPFSLSLALSLSPPTGLGRSGSAEAPAAVGQLAPAGFLREVCERLSLSPVVVISPSLSGMYSLPFVLQHPALVRAYVPVAPICTENFTAEQYRGVKVQSACTVLL